MKNVNFAAVVSALILSAASANAEVILRTGVDAGGAALAAGSLDPFWDISVDGGTSFSDAKAAYPDQICCAMDTVAPVARWITDPSVVDGNSATGWGVGNTVFLTRTFDLSGYDLASVALSGTWRVADNSIGIFINGNLLAGTTIGSTWDSDFPVSLAAGSGLFANGINTIEMRGSSGNSNWDGFWLDAVVDGRRIVEVPEPASLALLGLGLAGLRLSRRRKAA